MWKNLQALCKRVLFLLFSAVLLAAGNFLCAQESIRWYRSNSSGIALEQLGSRLAALRNEFCLSIEKLESGLIPEILIPYHENSYIAELRVLYENREESRRQWIFRDEDGFVRLAASGNRAFFGETEEEGEEDGEKETAAGFIELRDSDGSVVTELLFDEDLSQWEFSYSYRERILISSEVWYKEPQAAADTKDDQIADDDQKIAENEDEEAALDESVVLEETGDAGNTLDIVLDKVLDEERNPEFVLLYTDYYHYSRPLSLRAIERVISSAAGDNSRLLFPRLGPGGSRVEEIVKPTVAYIPEFLAEAYNNDAERINYTLDSRGRILTEVRKDDEGEIIGEIQNTWDGDRLGSILWKSKNQVLLVEYEYDSEGNRIAERNYKQGVLERSVVTRDGRETEYIYMNGKLILRAVWEKGIKISEERITPPMGGR